MYNGLCASTYSSEINMSEITGILAISDGRVILFFGLEQNAGRIVTVWTGAIIKNGIFVSNWEAFVKRSKAPLVRIMRTEIVSGRADLVRDAFMLVNKDPEACLYSPNLVCVLSQSETDVVFTDCGDPSKVYHFPTKIDYKHLSTPRIKEIIHAVLVCSRALGGETHIGSLSDANPMIQGDRVWVDLMQVCTTSELEKRKPGIYTPDIEVASHTPIVADLVSLLWVFCYHMPEFHTPWTNFKGVMQTRELKQDFLDELCGGQFASTPAQYAIVEFASMLRVAGEDTLEKISVWAKQM